MGVKKVLYFHKLKLKYFIFLYSCLCGLFSFHILILIHLLPSLSSEKIDSSGVFLTYIILRLIWQVLEMKRRT